ncbi:MFS transporter [Candidatus Tisiphia endosymbiont of Nemotelus uliginosus]|uniref:MFS transporter n=1 Tax=Candidatus Tisiphia endosymbiont of Nemotelus uliginosus TaxID=3077926 RepID=UPI0035C89F32
MSKLISLEGKYTISKYPLTREQKEAIGLLSIGTFLEYFDLMLYIHMAVLLNDLFFPESAPYMKKLLAAFTFCITYLLRPIGALILGWVGDTIGRKTTVVITTFMMAISCMTIATLPTYNEIGITASCVMVACRIIQGMTSMGEIIGAELYLTETIKRPQQYSVVSLLSLFAALGGTAALGIASLTTTYQFNWRTAFWIGALVALIGSVARTALRETPEFVDAKRRKKVSVGTPDEPNMRQENATQIEEVNNATALALFLIRCAWPVCFYLAFIHCQDILIENFHYTAAQVIHQNFFVALIEMLGFSP